MKEIIKYGIVLLLICSVSAGMLALIYKITEPRIIEQCSLEEKRAIEEVLPQKPTAIEKIEKEDLTFYKAKDVKDNLIAYVFITEGHGYSSDIRTVASLKPDGTIIAVKILEQAETPGIGSSIEENKFLTGFKNRGVDEQFDTITGATISSRAVINSLRTKAQKVLKYGR